MKESKSLQATLDNIHKLMEIPILKDFKVDHLENLIKKSKVRSYQDGEEIIKEGDEDRWLYFILSGSVRILKNNQELASLKRIGDMFGEMSLLNTSKRSSSAYAAGDTICFATDASSITTLAGEDKYAFCYLLYRAFATVLADRLRTTSDELVKTKSELSQTKKQLAGKD
jgi:CRP/FNR family transcriptional regulator, cyclic AMP receptor protein